MSKALQDEARRIEMQLQAIRRTLRQGFEAEVAKGNLTAPQQLVAAEVIRHQGISLKELSARVSLAHSTVSGIVDRLEKRGLIVREVSPADKRVTLIMASAAVRDFLQTNMPQLMLQPLVAALAKASPAERRAVAAGLNTLERLLERA